MNVDEATAVMHAFLNPQPDGPLETVKVCKVACSCGCGTQLATFTVARHKASGKVPMVIREMDNPVLSLVVLSVEEAQELGSALMSSTQRQ